MIIKVCGIANEQIREVDGSGVDLIGRIFHADSPRDVSEQAPFKSRTPQVGVFVNVAVEEILKKAHAYRLSVIQLHGSEEVTDIIELRSSGLKVIKAIAIGNGMPARHIQEYAAVSDYMLLDTKGESAGGNGRRFDWDLLNSYAVDCPFILSGGIGPEHTEEIRAIDHPQFAGIDVNSGFETRPGRKNIKRLNEFIKALRHE